MSIFPAFPCHAREGMGRGLIVADIDTFMMKHFTFSSSAMGIVVHFMNRAQMHFQNNFQIIPDIRPTFGDAPHPPPLKGLKSPKRFKNLPLRSMSSILI